MNLSDLCRAALEAVSEAIDLPQAATADDDEIRDEIMAQRADRAAWALHVILSNADDDDIVRGAVVMLRSQLRSFPYKDQYGTWVEAYGSHPLETTR